ncbi:MAG: hypothetical protein QOF89_761 [Acidobacteriota bacterium]|jgi:hypothetical protein|nr:hypothetical protein [Acidobacteriota bacterium]
MQQKEKTSRLGLAGRIAIVALLLTPGVVLAQAHGDRHADQLTATIVNMEGGGTAPVVIHIDHYSSEAEVQRLKGILADKGPSALRDALWDLEAGYIRVGGGLGYPIAVATSRPDGKGGRVVRLMMDRPISYREAVTDALSRDYPFSYVEIPVNGNGKGEGKFIAAARVSITAGTVDIESYGIQPLRLLNVRTR